MIIKAKARANGSQLGTYLVSPGQNERIEVIEVRGVAAPDVPGAVREMDAVAICTRAKKPLYHASINTRVEERLTPQQRARAVDRLERELGFTGQPRVVVVHVKKDREHTHVVWSRTDLEHGRALRIDHNFRKHETVARELEKEFGHGRVQGAHVERNGQDRPARTPGRDEMQQASRTGLKPQQAKEQITELWRSTDSGRAFQAAIAEMGWLLARGDRRDFVIVDAYGGTHSLARRVEGATAKHVRDRMADIDIMHLPTVQEARAQQLARPAPLNVSEPDLAEEEKRRRNAPRSDGLGWTDRAGLVQQERSAMNWVKAASRPGPSEKKLRFADDRKVPPAPSKAPAPESGEKRLKFFEDKKPDKDIDRER